MVSCVCKKQAGLPGRWCCRLLRPHHLGHVEHLSSASWRNKFTNDASGPCSLHGIVRRLQRCLLRLDDGASVLRQEDA